MHISQNVNPLKYTGVGAQKDKDYIFYLTFAKPTDRDRWFFVYYGESMAEAKRYFARELWRQDLEDKAWAAAKAK
jgi:hypothetical protein